MIQTNKNLSVPIQVNRQQARNIANKKDSTPAGNGILMNVQRKKMPAVNTTNCRKRSAAEPRPHPPHLLNKRYWDDVKAGRTAAPPLSTSDSGKYGEMKTIKSEPITSTATEHDQRAVAAGQKRRREQSPILQKNQVCSPLKKVARPTTSVTNNPSPQPQQGGGFRLPFPAPSGNLSHLPASQTMPIWSPQGFPVFPPPPPLNSARFLPFIHPPMFPGAAQLPQATTLPINPLLQFPQMGEQQNASTFWQALSLFGNILRNQSGVNQTSQQSDTVGTTEAGGANTDEHIDRMLDEMVMGQMRNEHQQKENITKERLCIVPIPFPVPIPLPLTAEFITKHYGKRS